MNQESVPYRGLCTEFYELDTSNAPEDALQCYLDYAAGAQGKILEPMCGTGRFLVPLLEKGYSVIGFDYSPHMLNVCRKKCKDRGLSSALFEATFETVSSSEKYSLIFIPSGSFGHWITPKQITTALTFIADRLHSGGKFVFEVETLKSIRERLLNQHGLKVIGKWQAEPHSRKEANDSDEVILYECVKSSRE